MASLDLKTKLIKTLNKVDDLYVRLSYFTDRRFEADVYRRVMISSAAVFIALCHFLAVHAAPFRERVPKSY